MKNTQTQTKIVVAQMIGQVLNNPCIKQTIDNIAREETEKLEIEKKLLVKEYDAQVKGWTYDNLFIKVTDSDGFLTGRSNWKGFEELIQKLRDEAIASGYRDIKVNMTFV